MKVVVRAVRLAVGGGAGVIHCTQSSDTAIMQGCRPKRSTGDQVGSVLAAPRGKLRSTCCRTNADRLRGGLSEAETGCRTCCLVHSELLSTRRAGMGNTRRAPSCPAGAVSGAGGRLARGIRHGLQWGSEARTEVGAGRNIDGPQDGVRRALRRRAAVAHALLGTSTSHDDGGETYRL